LPPKTKLLCNY